MDSDLEDTVEEAETHAKELDHQDDDEGGEGRVERVQVVLDLEDETCFKINFCFTLTGEAIWLDLAPERRVCMLQNRISLVWFGLGADLEWDWWCVFVCVHV